MSKLPIEIDWTKIPGPKFVGGPDGRIVDLDDWLVLVKGHLLLQSAVTLTREEAKNKEVMEDAQRRCVALIERKVYGRLRYELNALRRKIIYSGHEDLVEAVDLVVKIVEDGSYE